MQSAVLRDAERDELKQPTWSKSKCCGDARLFAVEEHAKGIVRRNLRVFHSVGHLEFAFG